MSDREHARQDAADVLWGLVERHETLALLDRCGGAERRAEAHDRAAVELTRLAREVEHARR